MIIGLKSERIYEELKKLKDNKTMQRDLIRDMRNGGKDFFFLNCLRMECNYLNLNPVKCLNRTWKFMDNIYRCIEELYLAGFLNETERQICYTISETMLYVLKKNRFFVLLCCFLHKQKEES